IEHVAFDVELPAVVDAAEAAFFVAPEKQRRASMRAVLAHEPDAAVGVAESDQLLAEQAHARRRRVGRRNFLGQERGQPIPTHQLAHRRARTGSRQQLVLLFRKHRNLSLQWLKYRASPAQTYPYPRAACASFPARDCTKRARRSCRGWRGYRISTDRPSGRTAPWRAREGRRRKIRPGR